ncbi:hypothetical protein ACI65C_004743 [Semiaphis heraclei]
MKILKGMSFLDPKNVGNVESLGPIAQHFNHLISDVNSLDREWRMFKSKELSVPYSKGQEGMLCRHCSQLIPINDKNHKCSAISTVSAYPGPSTSKPSLFSDLLTEMESEELNVSLSNLTENTSDDDDNEFYSSLIAEVNE